VAEPSAQEVNPPSSPLRRNTLFRTTGRATWEEIVTAVDLLSLNTESAIDTVP